MPASGYGGTLGDISNNIGIPNLPVYIRRFVHQHLNPLEDLPDEEHLPSAPKTIRIFHSANVTFHSPSDISGRQGMRKEIIRSTPNWRRSGPRRDTVLIGQQSDFPGPEGLAVARVRLLFSFRYNGSVFPCALLEHFRFIGHGPDPATGMWEIAPQYVPRNQGGGRWLTVEHLDTISRAIHLLPKFGHSFMPLNWPHSLSLDSFTRFYVNKFADHHLHEILS